MSSEWTSSGSYRILNNPIVTVRISGFELHVAEVFLHNRVETVFFQ